MCVCGLGAFHRRQEAGCAAALISGVQARACLRRRVAALSPAKDVTREVKGIVGLFFFFFFFKGEPGTVPANLRVFVRV